MSADENWERGEVTGLTSKLRCDFIHCTEVTEQFELTQIERLSLGLGLRTSFRLKPLISSKFRLQTTWLRATISSEIKASNRYCVVL